MITTFHQPESVSEVLELKAKFGDDIQYLSGGTYINHGAYDVNPESVISLEKLNLKQIINGITGLSLQAGVTLQELIDSHEIPDAIKAAIKLEPSRNIRNMTTIGGCIAMADFRSGLLVALLTLNTRLLLGDQSYINIEDYIEGDRRSLILSIDIPLPFGKCATKKITRSTNGLPIAIAAVCLKMNRDKITQIKIAVGAVELTARRLKVVEKKIEGSIPDMMTELESVICDNIQPQADFLGSVDYKKYITATIIRECIETCMKEEI